MLGPHEGEDVALTVEVHHALQAGREEQFQGNERAHSADHL